MTREELAEEKKRRFAFTKTVYEETQANEMAQVNLWELGKQLGLDKPTTDRIFQYLSAEGILLARSSGGGIGITHAGIREVEAAIDKPDAPTEHFPAFNVVYVGEMHNSQIQQGSPHATQNLTITQNDLDKIKDFAQELRRELHKLPWSDDQRQEAEAELATIEAQSQSSKPKVSVIKIALTTLKDLLLHTGGSIIAEELMKHMPHF